MKKKVFIHHGEDNITISGDKKWRFVAIVSRKHLLYN